MTDSITMKAASLFTGIGGFDLAAEWMGWETVLQCEINPVLQRLLRYYWPKAKLFSDITKTDFSEYAGLIDILTGGFPCQPFSEAGLKLGTEDSRHLWPFMLRAIKQIKPRWIVGENVRGIITWNGGLVFDQVQADLEAEGYEVSTFLLPACSISAPHQRDRVWFVAHSNNINRGQQFKQSCGKGTGTRPEFGSSYFNDDTNTHDFGLQGQCDSGKLRSEGPQGIKRFKNLGSFSHKNWQDFPRQPPVCGRNDGLPLELDGITVSEWRKESIKGYGNAIIPQLAFQIFNAIAEYEMLYN